MANSSDTKALKDIMKTLLEIVGRSIATTPEVIPLNSTENEKTAETLEERVVCNTSDVAGFNETGAGESDAISGEADPEELLVPGPATGETPTDLISEVTAIGPSSASTIAEKASASGQNFQSAVTEPKFITVSSIGKDKTNGKYEIQEPSKPLVLKRPFLVLEQNPDIEVLVDRKKEVHVVRPSVPDDIKPETSTQVHASSDYDDPVQGTSEGSAKRQKLVTTPSGRKSQGHDTIICLEFFMGSEAYVLNEKDQADMKNKIAWKYSALPGYIATLVEESTASVIFWSMQTAKQACKRETFLFAYPPNLTVKVLSPPQRLK